MRGSSVTIIKLMADRDAAYVRPQAQTHPQSTRNAVADTGQNELDGVVSGHALQFARSSNMLIHVAVTFSGDSYPMPIYL